MRKATATDRWATDIGQTGSYWQPNQFHGYLGWILAVIFRDIGKGTPTVLLHTTFLRKYRVLHLNAHRKEPRWSSSDGCCVWTVRARSQIT